jgi:hypothetical protein
MYRIPMRGLFLTCTKESIFIKNTQVIKILLTRVYIWNKTLTRNAGSLSMAATHHPCWSLAQSQLPHCSPLPSVPMPIPPNTTFIYIQTTLTRPLPLDRVQLMLLTVIALTNDCMHYHVTCICISY